MVNEVELVPVLAMNLRLGLCYGQVNNTLYCPPLSLFLPLSVGFVALTCKHAVGLFGIVSLVWIFGLFGMWFVGCHLVSYSAHNQLSTAAALAST